MDLTAGRSWPVTTRSHMCRAMTTWKELMAGQWWWQCRQALPRQACHLLHSSTPLTLRLVAHHRGAQTSFLGRPNASISGMQAHLEVVDGRPVVVAVQVGDAAPGVPLIRKARGPAVACSCDIPADLERRDHAPVMVRTQPAHAVPAAPVSACEGKKHTERKLARGQREARLPARHAAE